MINFKDLLIYAPIVGVGGSGGGGVTIKNQNKTITENGTYTADSGYTGLGRVEVDVHSTVSTNGGGWVGTPVPREGYVDKVYVNTALSNEQVAEILSGIDFRAMHSYYGITGDFVISNNTDKGLCIMKLHDEITISYVDSTLQDGGMDIWSSEQGWGDILDYGSTITFDSIASTNLEFIQNSQPDYTGPIGAQNELLSQLFSITPFVQAQGEAIQLDGNYDGSAVTVTENGAFDVKALLDEKKLPLTVDVAVQGGGENKLAQLVSNTLEELTAEDFGDATIIEQHQFYKKTSLKKVEIPEGITSIGDSAFAQISTGYDGGLREIHIPKTIKSITTRAFLNAIRTTNSEDNAVYYGGTVEDWCSVALGGSDSTPFYRTENVFFNGIKTEDVVIPSGITKINNYSFCNTYFKSISLPEGLTEIGMWAFKDTLYLKTLIIPATVQILNTYALGIGNTSEKGTLIFLSETPPTLKSSSSISDTTRLEKIIVPKGCGDAYKSATNWTNFAKFIEEATE